MTALSGKIALMTGASRGIGRAIARRLARDEAIVRAYVFRVAPIADIAHWGKVRGRLIGIMRSRAVARCEGKPSPRAKPSRGTALPQFCPRELRDLELVWPIPRECEHFRLFRNNRDDPSRTNFLFSRTAPGQRTSTRPKLLRLGSRHIGHDGTAGPRRGHSSRSLAWRAASLTANHSNRMLTNHLRHLPCRLACGRENFRTPSSREHQRMSSMNILTEHRGTS